MPEDHGSSAQEADIQPGKSKTVADILAAAADLIAPEGRWTQQEGARTPEGWGVQANDPRACAWDIIGAIHKVSPDADLTDRAKNFMLSLVGNLATYNDASARKQAEVVSCLRAAADRARTADAVGIPALAGMNPNPPQSAGE